MYKRYPKVNDNLKLNINEIWLNCAISRWISKTKLIAIWHSCSESSGNVKVSSLSRRGIVHPKRTLWKESLSERDPRIETRFWQFNRGSFISFEAPCTNFHNGLDNWKFWTATMIVTDLEAGVDSGIVRRTTNFKAKPAEPNSFDPRLNGRRL